MHLESILMHLTYIRLQLSVKKMQLIVLPLKLPKTMQLSISMLLKAIPMHLT
jgi:hypothetical protein